MSWWQEIAASIASAAALLLLSAIAAWMHASYQRFVSMDASLRTMRDGLNRVRLRHRRVRSRVDDVEETVGEHGEQLADHQVRIEHLETKEGLP